MNDIHYRELAMSTSFEVQQNRPVIERDVVVIGAGPAGMMAAYTLKKAGKYVAVVDARNRAGGRTRNGRVADASGNEHVIEIGGQCISPDQTRLISLVDELGLDTFKRYREGESVYIAPDGTRTTYSGDIMPLSDEPSAERDRLLELRNDKV